MRKGMAFITAFLLCLMTVPAFALGGAADGNSISPHAEGVCAPNDMIIQAEDHERVTIPLSKYEDEKLKELDLGTIYLSPKS